MWRRAVLLLAAVWIVAGDDDDIKENALWKLRAWKTPLSLTKARERPLEAMQTARIRGQ